MYKKYFLMIFIGLFIYSFSNEYNFIIKVMNSDFGSIKINQINNEFETVTEIYSQKAKISAKTTYEDDFYKSYSFNMKVNEKTVADYVSNYDGKKVIHSVNSIELPVINESNLFIVDNNFIIDHFWYFLKKHEGKGKAKIFIPFLSMNNQTFKNSIVDADYDIKDDKMIFTYSGLRTEVFFDKNFITKISIPSQGIEIERNDFKEKIENNIISEEVSFESKGLILNGTLSYPSLLSNKMPLIILVHGSGVLDRDERFTSAGIEIAPFYDLAEELNKKGFAVFRYDKRNFVLNKLGEDYLEVSIYDFIDDAINAYNKMLEFDFIAKDRIIFAGHSQGATLIPYILKKAGYAGISLSPAVISFVDLMVYQIEYQQDIINELNTDGSLDNLVDMLNEYLPHVKEIKSKFESNELKNEEVYMGFKGSFIKESDYLFENVVEEFVDINKNILIISGKEDLKTPSILLQEKEDEILKNDKISIKYIEGMSHEMYNQYIVFEPLVSESIFKWYENLK